MYSLESLSKNGLVPFKTVNTLRKYVKKGLLKPFVIENVSKSKMDRFGQRYYFREQDVNNFKQSLS